MWRGDVSAHAHGTRRALAARARDPRVRVYVEITCADCESILLAETRRRLRSRLCAVRDARVYARSYE